MMACIHAMEARLRTEMENLLRKDQEMEDRLQIAESGRKEMEARFREKIDDLEDRARIAELNRKEMETRLQIAESDRKEMEIRLQIAESDRKEMEAQIELIKQQSISRRTWSVVRSVQDLIDDAITNFYKLPGHTIVPHMRTLTAYQSDAEAINTAATNDELASANGYIESLVLDISVRDFVELGIEDAVAVTDRTGSGGIWFSTDTKWGLERLANENEAKFACRTILSHEIGHKTWYQFRGEGKDNSPESFKGTLSKDKSDGAQVIPLHSSPQLSPK